MTTIGGIGQLTQIGMLISHEQLVDMKKFTEDLYEKLKTAESRVRRLKSDICQLNELHEKVVKLVLAHNKDYHLAQFLSFFIYFV